MPVTADDDVVVQGDAKRPCDLHDRACHRDIGGRGGRVARGMIVHEDQRRGTELERAFDDLPGIDRRVVNGSALLSLILDQHILAIKDRMWNSSTLPCAT